MNYSLNKTQEEQDKASKTGALSALKKLLPLMTQEKKILILAGLAILVNSGLNLFSPTLVGKTVDHYIQTKQYHGVIVYSGILFVMYVGAFIAGYIQTKLMGGVGQRVLFNLRNAIFNKLQELPVAFFNQNKAGDLISRINNDTDKLNQFFSRSLMQFIGNIFIMIGAAIFLVSINLELGLLALSPAFLLLIFTRVISPWVKKKNAVNLKSTGGMSAEIQESLDNFKVIIAFNRRDYFRKRFSEVNENNYKSAISAGVANNIFTPIYGFSSNLGQMVVISFGLYLISTGHFTLGLLISFLAYINSFYTPLRQLAALWADFQVALAAWDRISDIISLDSDLPILSADQTDQSTEEKSLLEFKDVAFGYPDGKPVIQNINFKLERGKTYALVGPTGGGKTTTASLMARLYDPTSGTVLLDGQDIRTYNPADRVKKIGFILQEPYLFTGTVKENILYGNEELQHHSSEELEKILKQDNLEALVSKFDDGLNTEILAGGNTISLGQKQLIAFIRAVLRNPDLLILDEATSNIDTVTEQLLEDILKKLPAKTTKVIIAHRLNTIENADEIFFVNGGEITMAGSMDHAVEMLMHHHRKS